jgi:hypothetical protein
MPVSQTALSAASVSLANVSGQAKAGAACIARKTQMLLAALCQAKHQHRSKLLQDRRTCLLDAIMIMTVMTVSECLVGAHT